MVEFFRRILILAVILIFGFGAAVAVPSLVKAHSRTVRLEGDDNRTVDEPGVFVEPNTIHATNGYTTFYVAKTGDGTDPTLGWSTAYTQVQQALSAALSGDEIWVAVGVYTPGETISDSFNLVPGVSVYGGFNISDTQLSDRDLSANVTVLSGDIDGNDLTDANGVVTDTDNITGTNSYHVIWADGTGGTSIIGTTSLEDFTITAGNAEGSSDPNNDGGGFYCDGSQSGSNCSPTLSNIIFSGNSADDFGGAMYNYALLGGISIPDIANATFIGNSAGYGGAMANFSSISSSNASPSLSVVSFIRNTAEFIGGGIYNEGSYSGASSPIMDQVTFTGNTAGVWGGAMYNFGFGSSGVSSPKLTNVLISGNFSDQLGGALYNKGDTNGTSSPTLINVTISGNWADDPGGAMFNEGIRGGTSAPQVSNSVLWNNRDPVGITGIMNITATVTLTHSLVQGSGGSGNWTSDTSLINGGGNIDQAPLFVTPVSPSDAPTTDGNLRLASGSPAIDKGENDLSTLVPTDLDGNQRTQDGDGDGTTTVDMGAYETPTHYMLQVSTGGSGIGIITSQPAWINCGIVCDVTLPEGTQITLTANADTGSQFDGWSGACNDGGDCVLTMDRAKTVTVDFSLTRHNLSVNVTGDGSGTVTSQMAGIDCEDDCSEVYNYNQKVSLTPLADSGSIFSGWSGDCSGTGACEVPMTQARQVSAAFSINYGYSIYLPVEFR